jgi:hypothetical protein
MTTRSISAAQNRLRFPVVLGPKADVDYVDPVMGRYKNMLEAANIEVITGLTFYAITDIIGPNNVQIGCAESALRIVGEKTGKPVLEIPGMGPITLEGMIRRVKNRQLDVPIYAIASLRTYRILCAHGIARPDGLALFFVPADVVHGLPNAHWTVTYYHPSEEQYPTFPPFLFPRAWRSPFLPPHEGMHWQAKEAPDALYIKYRGPKCTHGYRFCQCAHPENVICCGVREYPNVTTLTEVINLPGTVKGVGNTQVYDVAGVRHVAPTGAAIRSVVLPEVTRKEWKCLSRLILATAYLCYTSSQKTEKQGPKNFACAHPPGCKCPECRIEEVGMTAISRTGIEKFVKRWTRQRGSHLADILVELVEPEYNEVLRKSKEWTWYTTKRFVSQQLSDLGSYMYDSYVLWRQWPGDFIRRKLGTRITLYRNILVVACLLYACQLLCKAYYARKRIRPTVYSQGALTIVQHEVPFTPVQRLCNYVRAKVFRGYYNEVRELDTLETQASHTETVPGLPSSVQVSVANRIALRSSVDKVYIMDTIKRMCHQLKIFDEVTLSRDVIERYVENIMKQEGMMVLQGSADTEYGRQKLDVTRCLQCRSASAKRRLLCKACMALHRHRAPVMLLISPNLKYFEQVGPVPLWSMPFEIPYFELEATTVIKMKQANGKVLSLKSHQDVVDWYSTQTVHYSKRGQLNGMMFCNKVVACFPRGVATTVVAFAIRLGSKREHAADIDPHYYDCLWEFTQRLVDGDIPCLAEGKQRVRKWTRQEYIDHLTDAKKREKAEAERERKRTYGLIPVSKASIATAFTKEEKKDRTEVDMTDVGAAYFMPGVKPRFIYNPPSCLLYQLGPYSCAKTKWLKEIFSWTKSLHYAGCNCPIDSNMWLRKSVAHFEGTQFWAIEDDVSACDASHSPESNMHQDHLDYELFSWETGRIFDGVIERKSEMSEYDYQLNQAAREIKVLMDNVWMYAKDRLGSGLPDTSYRNSSNLGLMRAIVLSFTVWPCPASVQERIDHVVYYVLPRLRSIFAGDDGLSYFKQPEFDVAVYKDHWKRFGFKVKAVAYSPPNWRLGTCLASRPFWEGEHYCWAIEPGRRLKTLFWQLSGQRRPIHPISWMKGVATQTNQQCGCVPIIGDICRFVLSFDGPTYQMPDQIGYTWNGYDISKRQNERGTMEFLSDYDISFSEYQHFVRQLKACTTPFQNCTHPVVYKLMEKADLVLQI